MTKSNLSGVEVYPTFQYYPPRGKPEPPIVRYVAAFRDDRQMKFRLT